ncbi:MAG: EAL domain-containing protein [Pseudomonadota bacterium]
MSSEAEFNCRNRVLLLVPESFDDSNGHRLLDYLDATDTLIVKSLDAAMAALAEHVPDVVMIMVNPDVESDTETFELLCQCVPETPLVVLAQSQAPSALRESAAADNHDVIVFPKGQVETVADDIRHAIHGADGRRQALRADARFRRLYENSIAGIFTLNADGDFLSANPSTLDILGFSSETEALVTNFVRDFCVSNRIGTEFLRCVRDTGSIRNAELTLTTADRRETTVLVSATSVLTTGGTVNHIEASMIDVTERKRAQDELTYLAKFDRLTGLANRYLFKETLRRELARVSRHERRLALMIIDLDRFKEVNDTLGHDAGDALLKAVGNRLRRCTRQTDIVARLGGDEFALLVDFTDSGPDAVALVAGKIIDSLGQPYRVNGHDVQTSPSIGIALSPEAGVQSDALLKAADIAMYRAKAEGRARYVFYSDELHDEVMDRVAMEQNLRSALERSQFSLVYQPKIDLGTGRIRDLEALLRWNCAERGVVSPVDFVPVLERTGLINPVGQWVMQTAVGQLRAWQEQLDLEELSLSVNLSVRQLGQHKALIDDIASVIATTGIAPQTLEFEITESSLMHDPDRCIQTLHALRDLGVRVSIDDFGTGFSSLQYLKALPIHGVKIDRTFVKDIPNNVDDMAIVKATLALAASLDLEVTAEGVETAEQVAFLREQGCPLAQGFYFARPATPERVATLLLSDPADLPRMARASSDARPDAAPANRAYNVDLTTTLQLPYFDLSRTRH